ncbi:MAG: trimethylamine methyltransferase family protein [Pseudomonadota bacterium]
MSNTPRRRGRRAAPNPLQQMPYRRLRRSYATTDLLSETDLDAVHAASLEVLETVGIAVLGDEARAIYADAGAHVEGTRVRLPPEVVLKAVASAPSEFTLHARNPEHDLRIGGDAIAFCSVASAPNAQDLDGGRRSGNQIDFRNFTRLSQHFNIVHMLGGYPVEPIDIPSNIRHLECLRDFCTLTDKPFHAYSLGRDRIRDAIEITRIARGVDDAQLRREPSLFTVINVNSPLTLDVPMSEGLIEMAHHNQVSVVTPFTLAGAMAPVSLAGALVQQNAEALAAIALTQWVRPGAPVIYGGFTSNVDMKSGAPAFGTPEYMKTAQIGGQLARRYGLPYRSSNVNAANSVDAQAAYESTFSLWGAVAGGANMLMHGAGWMEGGLSASFEKFVLDCDLLQMTAAYLEPVSLDPHELALDAIREVGPGGHFFGTEHTQSRYKSAFYSPLVSDWRNFETWSEMGAPQAHEKANRLWKQALQDYREPEMDPVIRAELDAFVNRRIAEGGVATDF